MALYPLKMYLQSGLFDPVSRLIDERLVMAPSTERAIAKVTDPKYRFAYGTNFVELYAPGGQLIHTSKVKSA
jgi:hypothetical protein